MPPETTNTSKYLLLGASSLFLGALHTYLFNDTWMGLNYPLFIAFTISAGLLLSKLFSRKITREQSIILALGMFFSVMVFVRSSELLTFFNILGSLLLLLISIDLYSDKQLGQYLIRDLLKIVILPFKFIPTLFETLPLIASLNNFSLHNKRTTEIVRGTIMAVIALCLFTWLLSGADALFAKLFGDLLTFNVDEDTIGRVLRSLFIAAFFIGAFGFMFKKFSTPATLFQGKIRNLGLIETSILLGAINILFFVFIALQISTLFGGQTHLIEEGLTYAESARSGFFQLIWVAIFSFIIVTFVEKQIILLGEKHLKLFKILSGVLVLQVVIMLVSAFQRLALYEQAYGFTTIRLYSHALMIWLALGLILLFYHIWKSEKPEIFAFRIFASVVIFLLSMNLLNPDVFIAKKNLERYTTTGNIDAMYLASLSDDALPYTMSLLDDQNEEIRKSFAHELYQRNMYCMFGECTDEVHTSWKSKHLNQKNIESLISERKDIIEASKNYQNDIIDQINELNEAQ